MSLSKERKYILIGGAVLLALALGYRFAPSLDGVSVSAGSISAKEEKLAGFRRIVHKRQALEERLKMLNTALAKAERGLLSGKTAALSAVEVQNVIRKIVVKKGATLRSMRVLKPKGDEEAAYLGVAVEATVQATVRQLKDVLFEIETTKTLLNIREVRLRAVRQKKRTDLLQATLTVVGYIKK